MIYFNEIDKSCCEWLDALYPESRIDQRSIADVQPADLVGLRRCHFFAGVAGWQLALELAGWPDEWECWSGSCPCQPFSAAGKRRGAADERHLWPEFFRLIRECRPTVVFGEQVASKDGLLWLDGVRANVEGAGYAFGAADLCAAGIGAPHIRQRLFWCAISAERLCDRNGARHERIGRQAGKAASEGERAPAVNPLRTSQAGWVRDAARIGDWSASDRGGDSASDGEGRERVAGGSGSSRRAAVADGCPGGQGCADDGRGDQGGGAESQPGPGGDLGAGGLPVADSAQLQRVSHAGELPLCERDDGDADGLEQPVSTRLQERECDGGIQRDTGRGHAGQAAELPGNPWSDFLILPYRDDKYRRISPEPSVFPLAHGIPSKRADPRLGQLLARLELLGVDSKTAKRLLARARRNRVGRLRGFGNAIVPQLAAEFVRTVMEYLGGHQ